MTRILIVEYHLMVSDALACMLGAAPGFVIVGQAASIRESIPLVEHCAPDLLLVALSLEDGSGIDLVRTLRRSGSKAHILIMTAFRQEFAALEALAAGASGYILKKQPTADLFAAIDLVRCGRTYISPIIAAGLPPDLPRKTDDSPLAQLSPREREIFGRVVIGSSTKEISATLFISTKTVDTHRCNINRKLGVRSTANLIRFAVAHGIAVTPAAPSASGP